MIQFDEHIFQMGWNHHLGNLCEPQSELFVLVIFPREDHTPEWGKLGEHKKVHKLVNQSFVHDTRNSKIVLNNSLL